MSNWEKERLGNLVFVKGGKRLPKGHTYVDDNTSFPYIRVSDFIDGTVDMRGLKYISSTTSELIRNYRITKRDIYISIAGTIGLVGTIPPELDNAHLTENAAKLVIKKQENLSARFLVKYLSSENGIKQIQNKTIATSQPKLALFRIEELEIPLPPLEVQKQIYQNLDTVSELLALRKKQLEELDRLIKSVFYDMFGDPVTNDKGWEITLLSELIDSIKYGTSTPPDFSDNGFMFIRATNIKLGRINDKDMKFISFEEAEKINKCKLNKGDLIIVRSGVNTGDTCVISEKYSGQYAGYDLIITPNSSKINSYYLNELINTVYMDKVIKPLTRRAAQPHLNADQTKKLPIILPSLSLQNQFADIVNKIEEQKSLVKQSIEETQKLFDSLMSQYFD